MAGLPSAYTDDDLAAKQFDLLILRTQLAVLRADSALLSNMKRIHETVFRLEMIGNVPTVAKQMALILEVQTDEFWQEVTPQMLERVRVRLRDLVKLIPPGVRKPLFTDFRDEIGQGQTAPCEDEAVGTDKARFDRKVRQFLDAHRDHIALQKLRRAEQLTKQDLAELERMFLAEGVDDRTQLGALRAEGGLGMFLRSLLGLDRQATKETFGRVLNLGRMTASQIHFIDLIVNHLTERGEINPQLLYESPFTDLNDQGLAGVFSQAEAKQIIDTVNRINSAAVA